ncbi:glutathione-disulfide reductase [Variovorax sp. NFACC27]|uniref:glutathione-disulfide reductase n=1 Tax=unclassified Variovorax TaxID=663243 RepID=UPI0008990C64|nr:glutathione reductase (NADPH) [Variovorax sp. NFACC28]SEG97008.1 glutathione reductase (NADPH) [Variovorax sp. NFACC29]SFD87409.1 glutathione reductase (NADPH) [Variovorax sp. NFACC26]SFH02574.1 glutathione reductase (NADPH) [Variovorax sp. NFACC27]
MPTFDFDLFVIGGGSGGVRAARMAAQTGARVALAEAAELGGTCVNVGCIPKKLYSYAAGYAESFEEAAGYGWKLPEAPQFDWAHLKAQRAKEITRLNGIYASLLKNAGVTLVTGWAQLVGPHTVEIGGKRHTARHLLVATGGTPFVPDIQGREHVVTSDAMFDLDPFPKRLLVVGGGYIACEFASIFNGLGSKVTQLHRRAHLLTGFDDDVRQFLANEMGKAGVDVRLNCEATSVTRGPDGLTVTLARGQQIEADTVLFATGRVPNTQGLGLEAAGVKLDERGAIAVDAHYRSSVPSIYAVGDVSTRVQLTPVALAEAMVVVDELFGKGKRRLDYEFIPTAVFTHPNIGTCGYTELEARAKFGEVTVFSSEFKSLRHTLSGSSERTFMKLVVEKTTDRVLGLHMVGADAGEIVQGFAVAMRAGATKAIFDGTVGIHPTAAEEFVTMREPMPG